MKKNGVWHQNYKAMIKYDTVTSFVFFKPRKN